MITTAVAHPADKRYKENTTPLFKCYSCFHLHRRLLITMLTSGILFISVILFLHSPSNSAYDIAVYGATPGGIAAAVTAARTSPSLKIALIEPTADIGGMSTGGGLGLRDLGFEVTSELIDIFSSLSNILFHFSQRIRCTRLGAIQQ